MSDLVHTGQKILQALLVVLLASCSFLNNDPENPVVYPLDSSGAFRLSPNDPFSGDSSMAWLSRGVVIPGYPEALYSLSFVGEGREAPDLMLYTLFEMGEGWGIRKDQVVEGINIQGRWEYRFSFLQPISSNWITSLQLGDSRYTGSVQDLRLVASGAGTAHMSMNLWITGKYAAPQDGESAEQLRAAIQQAFRGMYGPAGVVLDTVRLFEASKHPLVGARYPQNVPVIATGVEERFDSLGYGLSGEAANGLDLVLVFGLSEPGMLGESPLLGQSFKAGPIGTVVIATQQKQYAGESYSSIPTKDILGTALHEVGHFLGLRHTSATKRDLQVGGDYSIYEDGLSDTPFCSGLLSVSTEYTGNKGVSNWSRMVATAKTVALACPDQNNLMFPFAVVGATDPLTSQQGALLRNNVALFDSK